MINFRFHLVSLVAVFLALGVGVAMGASFVDRATVDTLRGRLDQLESNYRERGAEIDDLHEHLAEVDAAAEALLADGATLLADRLTGRNVVVVAPAELAPEAVDATWAVLGAADARRAGTLRLDPAVDLEDDQVLADVRDLLGLASASPELVRGRLVGRLAEALAILTASAPAPELPAGDPPGGTVPGAPEAGPEGTTTTTAPGQPTGGTPPPFRPLGPSPTADELDEARGLLRTLVEAGLLSVDADGVTGDAFPAGEELTYVVLVGQDTDPAMVSTLQGLAREVAELAPATSTVAETAPPRAPGELPTDDAERAGGTLLELRNDDEAVERLSTVDGLEEALGRLTLVLAVEEQVTGRVGHYGTGVGTTAAVPQSED